MPPLSPRFAHAPERGRPSISAPRLHLSAALLSLLLLLFWQAIPGASAQVNVLTAHNDIARTGQNVQETALTTSNVNSTQFGKLFSMPANGGVFTQPLYVAGVKIPNKGTHNVVYFGDLGDDVFALDADSNGGINALPLWRTSFLTNTTPAGTYTSNVGVMGTPVIDLPSKTLYVVSSEKQGTVPIYRFHALDITTGAEKFGGPYQITATVPGSGSGSVGGSLTFDPAYHRQRTALLLLNGVVYVAFGSLNDTGPWHGWIFSYKASSLQQISTFCTSASGSGAGIWMAGAGLAAEVVDPVNKPYGRLFFSTGNGSYAVNSPTISGKPYSNPANQYSMSVVNLDLTGGVMTAQDEFTPTDWLLRNNQDGDLGSGGPVLLPNQVLASGKTVSPMIEVGKSGMLYILDRNAMGGFNATKDQVIQEIQTPESGSQNWGAGVWGTEAYWNNNIYLGGTNPGYTTALAAYSFKNGQLSATATSQSSELYAYPGPTPSISANGNTNGILWVLDNSDFLLGTGALRAHDATNLARLLYSSDDNSTRDSPGYSVAYSVPTIVNGKVYVGTATSVAVYGLLANSSTAPAPVISPASGTFTGSQTITMTDAVAGATIYYTTDGTVPNVYSRIYTGPFSITASQTITAVASPTGYVQSAPVSAVYSSTGNAANPVFSLSPGAYSGPQTLTITDNTPGAAIYYTVDGSTPSATSLRYTGPIAVAVTETIQAMATASGLLPSSVVTAAYTINPVYTFDFSRGFSQAQQLGLMQFNGSTTLDDFRLQLTNGGTNQAGSAFYSTPVNVQSFTTDFTFQISNPVAEGMTFTIQGVGPAALGNAGAGLGFVTIQKSIGIKFDIYNNAGEGNNSTGIYKYGNLPTTSGVNLKGSGINLRDGNYKNIHMTYDGLKLNMTITDPITQASWSHAFTINIPAAVGGKTAWVGFTAGTGGGSASQKVTSWTYLAGPPRVPNYPTVFDTGGLVMNNGASISNLMLQLTDGTANQTRSAYFGTPVDVKSFSAKFDFTITPPTSGAAADGLAFVIQNTGVNALGSGGSGMGYAGIPNSIALAFNVFNNVGQGNDSNSLYLNGSTSPMQQIDLNPTGLQLKSGHRIHAEITYDGTTLAWTLLDIDSPLIRLAAAVKAVINIPNVIGSNTAYVGFAAASGNGLAAQRVLNWAFTNP